jgi:hypothetical protein
MRIPVTGTPEVDRAIVKAALWLSDASEHCANVKQSMLAKVRAERAAWEGWGRRTWATMPAVARVRRRKGRGSTPRPPTPVF